VVSDPFLNFAPNHIFGMGEVRHFKFRLLVDTREYYACMILIYYPERDVFRTSASHAISSNFGK